MTLFTFAECIQERSYQCQSNSDKTPSICTDELLFIYTATLAPKLAEEIYVLPQVHSANLLFCCPFHVEHHTNRTVIIKSATNRGLCPDNMGSCSLAFSSLNSLRVMIWLHTLSTFPLKNHSEPTCSQH